MKYCIFINIIKTIFARSVLPVAVRTCSVRGSEWDSVRCAEPRSTRYMNVFYAFCLGNLLLIMRLFFRFIENTFYFRFCSLNWIGFMHVVLLNGGKDFRSSMQLIA